jgi:hypothetical protein
MACRGVLFAVTDDEGAQLRKLGGNRSPLDFLFGRGSRRDEQVLEAVEEIEERWEQDWLCETDKAWDAIHRCLGDGNLGYSLNRPSKGAILGGEPLYGGEDYVISFKTGTQVKAIANALAAISDQEIGERYDALSENLYQLPKSAEDRAYTVEYFGAIRDFYLKAAAAGRPVVFTVDQ